MTSYNTSFYEGQTDGSFLSASKIIPYVISIVRPKSIADVGCGVGGWLAVAHSNGIDDIIGFDGDYVSRELLKIPEEKFIPKDLNKIIDPDRRFDMVISLEVAEHIKEENADNFVQSLVNLADVILFSAAPPGQGGTDHVNEQWPEYWISRFTKHNYAFLDCIRNRYWDDDSIDPWYSQNTFLFIKEDINKKRIIIPNNLELNKFYVPAQFVHPAFAYKIFACDIHNIYFSKALRLLPKLFIKALKAKFNIL